MKSRNIALTICRLYEFDTSCCMYEKHARIAKNCFSFAVIVIAVLALFGGENARFKFNFSIHIRLRR